MSEGDNIEALNKKLNVLFQQMEAYHLKLHDKIDNLFGTIRDIDNQQRAHHVAINRLEHGRNNLPGDVDQETIIDATSQSNRRHPSQSSSIPACVTSCFGNGFVPC